MIYGCPFEIDKLQPHKTVLNQNVNDRGFKKMTVLMNVLLLFNSIATGT